MYIPTYKIVDADELANEHNIPELNNSLSIFLAPRYLVEDHIRSWKDDDWNDIPPAIKQAYKALCDYEGFNKGDIFIWRL